MIYFVLGVAAGWWAHAHYAVEITAEFTRILGGF
jgi:hypothetical protein